MMVIPNCRGCLCDLHQAYDYEKLFDYFIVDSWITGLGSRQHIHIVMVDEKGKIVIGPVNYFTKN